MQNYRFSVDGLAQTNTVKEQASSSSLSFDQDPLILQGGIVW